MISARGGMNPRWFVYGGSVPTETWPDPFGYIMATACSVAHARKKNVPSRTSTIFGPKNTERRRCTWCARLITVASYGMREQIRDLLRHRRTTLGTFDRAICGFWQAQSEGEDFDFAGGEP